MQPCERVALGGVLLRWETWATVAAFLAFALLVRRGIKREERLRPAWSMDEAAVRMRAHRTVREVRWDELREVRLGINAVDDTHFVLYGAGEREVSVPFAEATRMGLLDRLRALPGFDIAGPQPEDDHEDVARLCWRRG